jgi:hypothetical protein
VLPCSRLVPRYEISPQFTVLCVTLNVNLSQQMSIVSLLGVCTFIILILSNMSLSANHKQSVVLPQTLLLFRGHDWRKDVKVANDNWATRTWGYLRLLELYTLYWKNAFSKGIGTKRFTLFLRGYSLLYLFPNLGLSKRRPSWTVCAACLKILPNLCA